MVMVINKWMNTQCTKQSDFSWSTFTVNRSWMSERHRDTNNVGPSAIVSFGEHVGGDLRWWPDDYPGGVIGALREENGQVLQPFHKVCFFNGTKAHETCPFEGNRVSIIFYELKWDATVDVKLDLRKHGFTTYGMRTRPKKKEKAKVQINQMVVNKMDGGIHQSDSHDQSNGKSEDVYKACPTHIVDQKCLDEDESYDLTDEYADEPGADTLALGDIKQMTGE